MTTTTTTNTMSSNYVILMCMNDIINQHISTHHKVDLSTTTNKMPVVRSKKASNARNVYYKPNIKHVQMRYSNLSTRTLRH